MRDFKHTTGAQEVGFYRNSEKIVTESEAKAGRIVEAELTLANGKFDMKKTINWFVLKLLVETQEGERYRIPLMFLPGKLEMQEGNVKPTCMIELTMKYYALLVELGKVEDRTKIALLPAQLSVEELLTQLESFAGIELPIWVQETTTIETKVMFGKKEEHK